MLDTGYWMLDTGYWMIQGYKDTGNNEAGKIPEGNKCL
jgi:hypothetical protein